MKKVIILVLIAMYSNEMIAQKKSEADTVRYSQVIDKSIAKDFKMGMDISTYVASDNSSYKQGDTLVLGVATGEGQAAFSKLRNFQFVMYGTPGGTLFKGVRNVEEKYQDYKLIVDHIDFVKGVLGVQNTIQVYTKPLSGTKFSVTDKFITINDFENALKKGEIKALHSNKPMTRDEAVEILKKKKEELDLGVISQKEFDELKSKLIPIIKGAN